MSEIHVSTRNTRRRATSQRSTRSGIAWWAWDHPLDEALIALTAAVHGEHPDMNAHDWTIQALPGATLKRALLIVQWANYIGRIAARLSLTD